MFKFLFLVLFAVAGTAWGQVSSALPADRLAFANQLAKRGFYADALREYEAIRDAPDLPRGEVWFRLGEAYRHLSRPQEALAAYARLLEVAPESRYVDYARLNAALLQDGAAKTAALRALDRDAVPAPLRATALYYLGEESERAKESAQAVDWYTRAARAGGTNEVVRLARLRAASLLSASSEQADRRRAMGVYLDLATSADSKLAEEALFFAGLLGYREGRYAEAALLFRQLGTRFPNGVRAKESRIYAAWAQYLSGQPAEALALASPLRESGIEDAFYLTAAALKALNRSGEARQAYEAYLAAYPSGRFADAAWTERLAVLSALGASADVLAALTARATPPDGTADRVWSYGCEAAIAQTNFTMAIDYAARVAKMETSPLARTAAHRLAWLQERKEDWAAAATAYRSLAARWPKDALAPQALYQAGVAETKAGRPEQARSDWTRLLTLYPDSPFAAEALYARAMEELRVKEYRKAGRSLDELFSRFPETPKRAEAYYWRAMAANGCGDAAEAEKGLRAARASSPAVEFAREIDLELAAVLKKQGKTAEAVPLLAGLLKTKMADRLAAGELHWLAESALATTNTSVARAAAECLSARRIDPAWNQIGAALTGRAYEAEGARDAAVEAYTRALAEKARTHDGAQAALALGRLETELGLFDEAKTHLSDAVDRARAPELIRLRAQAYAALARNEEERGDAAAALGYHLLVGTLFDDPEIVPPALWRAAAIMRQQGKEKDAAALTAELKQRYPSFAAPDTEQD